MTPSPPKSSSSGDLIRMEINNLAKAEFTANKKDNLEEAEAEFQSLRRDNNKLLSWEEFNPPSLLDSLLILVVVLSCLILPFVVGNYLSNTFRMPEYAGKIGIVLCALTIGVVTVTTRWPPKLGIDLRGGAILVYEIDQEKQKADFRPRVMKKIQEGLSAGEKSDFLVKDNQNGQIEITGPKSKRDEAVNKIAAIDFTLLDEQKNVEFAMAPLTEPIDERPDGESVTLIYQMTQEIQTKGGGSDVKMDTLIAAINRRVNRSGVKEVSVRSLGSTQIEITIPEVKEREVAQLEEKIKSSGMLQFRISANKQDDTHFEIIALALKSDHHIVYRGDERVAEWYPVGKDFKDKDEDYSPGLVTRVNKISDYVQRDEALILLDRYNVTGEYLTRAVAGFDEQTRPQVNFEFDDEGARRFGKFTKRI